MQGRGSVMGDHNWDLSTRGWRALEHGLTESGVRPAIEDDEEPSPSTSSRSLQQTDALWERGALY